MKYWCKPAREKAWAETTLDGWLDSVRSLLHWGGQAGGAIQPRPLDPGIPKEFATTQLLLCVDDATCPPADPPLLDEGERTVVALGLLGLSLRQGPADHADVERVARKIGVLDILVANARDWMEATKEGKADGNAVRVEGAGYCPTCTMPLTGVKPSRGGAPQSPSPDDVTICGNCGEILKFNTQMKVEPVNDQELTHLVAPVDVDQLLSLQKTLRAKYTAGRPR